MSERHEQFKVNLRRSQIAVAAMAAYYIRTCKFDVRSLAPLIPDTVEEGVSDNGDLSIRLRGEKDWTIVEVKGVQYTFDSVDTWPAIICDSVDGYAKKPADVYITVPIELDRALWIKHDETRAFWEIQKVKSGLTGRLKDHYLCPRNYWKEVLL